MRVVVTDVEVFSIPFTAPQDDRPWDLLSGPDLYYEAYGPDGRCLHASEAVLDVRPRDLPVTLEGEVSIEDPGPHTLRLLDADVVHDEVIARVSFEPGRLAASGPTADPPREVEVEDGDTRLRLTLSWPDAS